jgi:pimeloyl-ACP methyl ester carboxylesterase
VNTPKSAPSYAAVYTGSLYIDPLAVAYKLGHEIPTARKIVFPGTAHLLPMEPSANFNEDTLDFLSKEL